MFLMDYLITLLGVLLAVAFFTLMERKVMGLMHYRKGPSKVVIFGISQPVADAVKLLSKESTKMSTVKLMMFITGPLIGMTIMMVMWAMFEFSFVVAPMSMKIIAIFTAMSLTIYSMLLMSWGSNSKYAMLGGHRAVAQVMSYEVCLFITILVIVFMSKSYKLQLMSSIQQGLWVMGMMMPLALVWMLMCLAESNRTPFDMAEGESEIVSGFNIEYGSGLFAMIFISEYGMIMMLSFITSAFFLGGSYTMLKTFMVTFVFVWARCSFPRVRYDNLMMLAWKMALPYILSAMTMSIMV